MRRLLVLSVLAGLAVLAVVAWTSHGERTTAAQVVRVVVPAVAADSRPALPEGSRQVVLSVDLEIHEPAVTGTGFTLVRIHAGANGPLPGQFDPPVTVPGTATITAHSGDVCSWAPEVVQSGFTMTYSQPQGQDLQLHFNFSSLQWHYQVTCGDAPPIRFPQGGVNESLVGWMGLIFPGMGGPAGATIDTPVVSEAGGSCVKRKGKVANTSQFGTGTITVWVTQPPCLIPIDID